MGEGEEEGGWKGGESEGEVGEVRGGGRGGDEGRRGKGEERIRRSAGEKSRVHVRESYENGKGIDYRMRGTGGESGRGRREGKEEKGCKGQWV